MFFVHMLLVRTIVFEPFRATFLSWALYVFMNSNMFFKLVPKIKKITSKKKTILYILTNHRMMHSTLGQYKEPFCGYELQANDHLILRLNPKFHRK